MARLRERGESWGGGVQGDLPPLPRSESFPMRRPPLSSAAST